MFYLLGEPIHLPTSKHSLHICGSSHTGFVELSGHFLLANMSKFEFKKNVPSHLYGLYIMQSPHITVT